MKISYRTHPVLESIEKKQLKLPANLWACGEKIRLTSKPFADAIEKSWDKFPKDTWQYVMNEHGVLVGNAITLVYAVKGYSNFELYVFNSQSSYYFGCFKCINGVFKGEISKELIARAGGNAQLVQNAFISELFVTLAFINFVDIEKKTLSPKSRDKAVVCKYVNDSKSTIEVLDCKWYTTLHYPNSFPVRGHFRWQPCGEGLKDRKLIWINDFMKEGYTAPARKLSA